MGLNNHIYNSTSNSFFLNIFRKNKTNVCVDLNQRKMITKQRGNKNLKKKTTPEKYKQNKTNNTKKTFKQIQKIH